MNDNVKIPKALVKRVNRVTAQVGVTPDALVKAALANQLDYEEWFLKAVDEGIADLDKTFREITQSARSFGLLVEYLELHPEALLKGKSITKGE
mgnify:CR=1 FL=1